MKKELVTCKNCEKDYDKEFQFCPHCGQKANDELTLGVLFYNTISNYFSFDARFFKSYIPLMFKPGYLPKRFIEGKRLLYLHPAQMYLFISVVFFFLFSIITRESTQQFDSALKKGFDKSAVVLDSLRKEPMIDSIKTEQLLKPLKENQVNVGFKDYKELDSIIKSNKDKPIVNSSFDFNEKKIDSLIVINASDTEIYKAMGLPKDAGVFKRKIYKQVLKFYKQRNGGSILQAFYDSIPIAMFILLPIFALLLKLFYYKKGSFSHHLVFTFYYFSFLFMVFSILILANLIFKISGILIGLVMFSTFFYLLLAVKRFYDKGYFSSFIKSGIISFLFLSFVIPLAVLIIGATAFLFY
jgi:RNA polymerase subunit RPABC4/transcription elongation factor Spt4